MIVRSKAPLRLGLGGGGTDLSPYCDQYGGYILNASIDMYSYCVIETSPDNTITFITTDRGEIASYPLQSVIEIDGKLDLHKGVYNRIIKDYNGGKPLPIRVITFSDAPAGSGLGTSSTLVVALIKAYAEVLNLPFGEYDIAHLAYEIERNDIGLAGGKQDQYCATFGGFNFMEFYDKDKVIVNPLRIREEIIDELEISLLLFYSGISRSSAAIIKNQINNTIKKKAETIEAMHRIKEDALKLKESLLKGDFITFSKIIADSWEAKKRTSAFVTNDYLEDVYAKAINAGAYSGKISGAGGGGYMFFMVDPVKKMDVKRVLQNLGGNVISFKFVNSGTKAWRV